jgi:hypothetical protein
VIPIIVCVVHKVIGFFISSIVGLLANTTNSDVALQLDYDGNRTRLL